MEASAEKLESDDLVESFAWLLEELPLEEVELEYDRRQREYSARVSEVSGEMLALGMYEVVAEVGSAEFSIDPKYNEEFVASWFYLPSGEVRRVTIPEGPHPELYSLKRELQAAYRVRAQKRRERQIALHTDGGRSPIK